MSILALLRAVAAVEANFLCERTIGGPRLALCVPAAHAASRQHLAVLSGRPDRREKDERGRYLPRLREWGWESTLYLEDAIFTHAERHTLGRGWTYSLEQGFGDHLQEEPTFSASVRRSGGEHGLWEGTWGARDTVATSTSRAQALLTAYYKAICADQGLDCPASPNRALPQAQAAAPHLFGNKRELITGVLRGWLFRRGVTPDELAGHLIDALAAEEP